MMERYIVLAVAAVLGLIGIIFMIAAVTIMVTSRKRISNCTVCTTGIVRDMQSYTTSGSNSSIPTTSWYPVYEYNAGSQNIRKRSYFGQTRQKFYIGQKVTIWYNPSNYNEFYVSEEKTEILKWIFGGVGILLLILGVLSYGMTLKFF